MAKQNRPAHGGLNFHKCGEHYLLELLDTNGNAFAHIRMTAGMVLDLAAGFMDEVAAREFGIGMPEPEGHA